MKNALTLVSTLILGSTLALGACGKDKKPATTEPAAMDPAKTGDPAKTDPAAADPAKTGEKKADDKPAGGGW